MTAAASGHRFPLSVIESALWLSHRFPLCQRAVQKLLHERGMHVSHETLRQWNIKFAPLLNEELRYREPLRGSRWHLDEVHVEVGGVTHWWWRAVDSYANVLNILLQEHRDTEASLAFLTHLLREEDVPEVIQTDHLWSYGAAVRERLSSASNEDGERRNSSPYTPEPRTFTARPERLPLHPSERTTQTAALRLWQEAKQQA